VLCEDLCDKKPGTAPDYDCRKENERDAIPECVDCEVVLPENAAFTFRCSWECVAGFYKHQVLSEPAECRRCGYCEAGSYPISIGCTAAFPFPQCQKCTNIPANAVPISNSLPECPWVCAPGYYLEYNTATGAPRRCVAHWLLKSMRDQFLNATTAVLQTFVSTTPRPIVQAVPENFPTRRSTSASQRASGQHSLWAVPAALVVVALSRLA